MMQSIFELEGGAQFAFYNLDLSDAEVEKLSKIKFSSFSNIVLYSSKETDLHAELDASLEALIYSGLNETAMLMSKLAQGVMCASKHEHVEIVIRAEPKLGIASACYYWHIDRSYQQVATNADTFGRPIHYALPMTFIMPLKGEGTIFYQADDEAKARLLSVANETKFFYGHTQRCSVNDDINVQFSSKAIQRTPRGFGSVHKTGISGAIHAAPIADSTRLLLLITPL